MQLDQEEIEFLEEQNKGEQVYTKNLEETKQEAQITAKNTIKNIKK